MASSIFVMSPDVCAATGAVAESLVKAVERQGRTALPFRPLAAEKADAAVATVAEALAMIRGGKRKKLLASVVKEFHAVAARCDVVVCLGSGNTAAPAAFEVDLNLDVAATLDAPLALAVDARGASLPMQVKGMASMAAARGVDIAAYFVCNGTCPMKGGADCCVDAPVFDSLTNDFVLDDAFARRMIERKGWRVNPVMFEYRMIEQARRHRMRIVLPEGTEPRILKAAEDLTGRGVADIILLGDEEAVKGKIGELGLEMGPVTIIDPAKSDKHEAYSAAYAEFRKAKGVTIEQAREKMLDGSYFGSMMVKLGDADGMVSGSINTTAHTIRPAFEFIKTKPGFSSVSGVFLMCMRDRVLVFADCAVTPNPTADQLAETAVASAATARVFGVEPRVAMLSYGTGTSGKGPSVDATVEATRKAKEKAPDLAIEGPIQYDAAMVPEVAATKLPGSPVAGKATVLVFPDLNAGNIGYKAVQRSADAVAIGPVLQGLNKPVNDLSRGCLVADIINTVAITAIQAQAERGLL